jgi:hypothetical protein
LFCQHYINIRSEHSIPTSLLLAVVSCQSFLNNTSLPDSSSNRSLLTCKGNARTHAHILQYIPSTDASRESDIPLHQGYSFRMNGTQIPINSRVSTTFPQLCTRTSLQTGGLGTLPHSPATPIYFQCVKKNLYTWIAADCQRNTGISRPPPAAYWSATSSCATSLTNLEKGSLRNKRSVDFWYFLISLNATVPGLLFKIYVFGSIPVAMGLLDFDGGGYFCRHGFRTEFLALFF